MTRGPLPKKLFDDIYSKVPRLTVEVIVKHDGKVFLTQRAIAPCEGQWHLPGGTVQFGEPLIEAVGRIAKRELGITVTSAKNVGVIEYPSHYKNGLDDPVGIAFEVVDYDGALTPNKEATAGDWFDKLPLNTHADQDDFLVRHNYLLRRYLDKNQ